MKEIRQPIPLVKFLHFKYVSLPGGFSYLVFLCGKRKTKEYPRHKKYKWYK
jgi:hypothetical protein